ncbi:MAG: hypothetical protein COB53_11375 [Elusimicrobia bacterium]|nr:MAG: hypothetical protein COB53_11375 [Elusimicrobiota bacterium]
MRHSLLKILLPIAASPAAALGFCIFATNVFAGESMVGTNTKVLRSAVANGGGLAMGTNLQLRSVVGDLFAFNAAGASRKTSVGYVAIESQPGTITSIIAVTKATGTLELSWTAPGRDGFVGAVTAGTYRIEYSTESSHPNSPLTFTVEFATSVVANATQSYTLTGLDPNTTYYTRVYLADNRKVFAEGSVQSAESTLAHPPASPVLAAVFSSSVTFTYAAPVGGAAAYLLEGSTTNFSGGTIASSATSQPALLTLTITGLSSDTPYFFQLASLNWQSDVNFTTLVGTRTRLGAASPIENLASFPDGNAKTISFSWSNPIFDSPAGVTILVSTNPISAAVVDGIAYPIGAKFPDGSIVLSSAADTSVVDANLPLHTTYYYKFYSRNQFDNYSVSVATNALLDLPPMSPGGMAASVSPDQSLITIRWAGVNSSLDGSGFKTGTPEAMELQFYDVFRATGLVHANWILIDTIAWSAEQWTGSVPVPGDRFYYRVVSRDLLQATDEAMVVDTDENLYAVGPDRISRLMIPAAWTNYFGAGGNEWSAPLIVKAIDKPLELGGKVVRATTFETIRSPGGEAAEGFQLPGPVLDVTMHYDVVDGEVVPSGFDPVGNRVVALEPLSPRVSAPAAAKGLGAYWFNGKEYVKLFGSIDTLNQTVNVKTALPGSFQVRSLFRDQAITFDLSQVSNKAITPNGDGLNDYISIRFDNPRDSSFTGRIFDMRGAFVSEMRIGTQVNDSLIWDGKAGGRVVPRGVYIYQIEAEGRVFNGTVVVIR